jgi:hypothetical protein
MFTIGLGFLLMKLGSDLPHSSGLTMLPGCLLAGIGLGMTNTPVTNTTTGSVPSTRAGMASGIDMSARLITLAINIALMGFILVEGVWSYLKNALPRSWDSLRLRSLAEKIAAGNLASLQNDFPELSSFDSSGSIVHAALVHGFGLVMLYGGIGVGILAGASFVIFAPLKVNRNLPLNPSLKGVAHGERPCED